MINLYIQSTITIDDFMPLSSKYFGGSGLIWSDLRLVKRKLKEVIVVMGELVIVMVNTAFASKTS